MQRPQASEHNPHFQKYIDLVPAGNYLDVLKQNTAKAINTFKNIAPEKQNHTYAEGKWTIKEMMMHIIDTERVMAYRALVAARGDGKTRLYGMDENLYAQNVNVTNRTMDDMLEEFTAVRTATGKLFGNLTEEQTLQTAHLVNHHTTARALGYVIAGHVEHHINILNERYL
jgi:hypothetical protein